MNRALIDYLFVILVVTLYNPLNLVIAKRVYALRSNVLRFITKEARSNLTLI